MNFTLPTSRRHVLAVLSGGAALAMLPGCAATGGQPDPIAAWRAPGAGEIDPRRYALAHAILAPNPHNRQPWLVDLPGSDEILLTFDTARRLPETDPFDRQLAIGCGSFLELLSIAAAEKGLRAEITPFPEGDPGPRLNDRPLAHVRLTAGAMKDALHAQIVLRRSNKEAYDATRTVPSDATAQITQAALESFGAVNPSRGSAGAALRGAPRAEELRTLIPAAYRREVETPAALKESIDLMRIGKREIARYRDGIDLDFPGVEALQAIGVITREKMMTLGTQAYTQGLEMYDPLAASAAGFVWLTANNDRVSQLACGRAYARMNLTATELGIAMHPMSQALQEYAEMAPLKAQADQIIGVSSDQRLQMLARIGYAQPVPPAPRRGLAEHLRA